MNERQPEVSIVLPTYNGSDYLRDSVQSCLAQTFEDFELICVDDASTDETPRILSELCELDDRMRVIRHETNKRLPAALNTGFRAARGKYQTWTSDDNLYEPHALEAMVRFLDTNEDVEVVYAAYSVIDADDRKVCEVEPEQPVVLFTRNVVGACFLHRQHVYSELGGYREEAFLAEDYDFWLRCFLRYRMEPLYENLYRYRHHDGALTARAPQEIRKARKNALVDMLNSAAGVQGRELSRAYLTVAQDSAALGDTVGTRRHLAAALLRRPGRTLIFAGRNTLATALFGARPVSWLRRMFSRGA